MIEVNCKGCGTPLIDGGVDWYCPSCDYSAPVKVALPLKPCCIEAAKAERDRIVARVREWANAQYDEGFRKNYRLLDAVADALDSQP